MDDNGLTKITKNIKQNLQVSLTAFKMLVRKLDSDITEEQTYRTKYGTRSYKKMTKTRKDQRL